ncbi:pyridoxamine 5'-phosphate oxidase family protein [Allokutzneria sp. A3M-2-11 16]|uniref:pyridoxamine 5'-phosphate oxidase family protein n=1 Tax=Allokutzneria sp. A3M-2-11 16 TaxID=2962043 RepID=UPI0020B84C75|nr:pyridoxamine 5'-phosphate oxidase family protein [Allokutzneria sp. A3M-2-11 16]MCP3798062.1 pyridoxamine 5'-phosphate oxidase family protein [Allokutzneria sp. A3M-2-11 16]
MTRPPLSPTERSTIQRGKQRAATERADLDEVLDAGVICHLGVVINGAPVVLPTCYGWEGDTLYVHGSTGASTLRTAIAGAEVSVAITLLDGIVYARSAFHHSANYRSAVVHGRARLVEDPDEKLHALAVITQQVAPGSWDYTRGPNRKELAATSVLALELTEAAVKIRRGPPVDDEEDVAEDSRWAGVLPVRQVWGEPEPCPLLPPGVAAPSHVTLRGASLGE